MVGDSENDYVMRLHGAAVKELPDGQLRAILSTSRGDVRCILHTCEGGTGAVVWVGGALGGFFGPGGLYEALGIELVGEGITSLRLDYRQPSVFHECVLDVLGGVSFLKGLGAGRVALVGHSFGGAVVIKAGELSPLVVAVAALSSQTYGAQDAANLAPRSLLLVHGTEDSHLAPAASQWIYDRAQEPKELVFMEGAGHRLQECQDELRALLKSWLAGKVGRGMNDGQQ